jgi:hypothetical protein
MALSAKNCPICDQMNQCISTCWCVLSDYSAVELIKRYQLAYPQASINKEQCVCQSCLAQMARMSLPALPVVQIFKPSI